MNLELLHGFGGTSRKLKKGYSLIFSDSEPPSGKEGDIWIKNDEKAKVFIGENPPDLKENCYWIKTIKTTLETNIQAIKKESGLDGNFGINRNSILIKNGDISDISLNEYNVATISYDKYFKILGVIVGCFKKNGDNEIYIPIFLFKNNKWEDLNDTIKKLKYISFSSSESTLTIKTLYRNKLKTTTNVFDVYKDEVSYSFSSFYSQRGDEVLIVATPKRELDSYVRYYYFSKFNLRTDSFLTASRSSIRLDGYISSVGFNKDNFFTLSNPKMIGSKNLLTKFTSNGSYISKAELGFFDNNSYKTSSSIDISKDGEVLCVSLNRDEEYAVFVFDKYLNEMFYEASRNNYNLNDSYIWVFNNSKDILHIKKITGYGSSASFTFVIYTKSGSKFIKKATTDVNINTYNNIVSVLKCGENEIILQFHSNSYTGCLVKINNKGEVIWKKELKSTNETKRPMTINNSNTFFDSGKNSLIDRRRIEDGELVMSYIENDTTFLLGNRETIYINY